MNWENDNDTIFQLSTGMGPGGTAVGVAIIRISGSNAEQTMIKLTKRHKLPSPRMATVCTLYHPDTKEILDSGVLCLYFPSPNSFTGEDIIEFHVHGNAVVVGEILNALSLFPCMRLANAGEFTRRAFENRKLDLTQVEGLADLLNAETEQQHKQAVRQLAGHLSQLYFRWRKEIIGCLAYCEAVIDFAEDEEDVGEEEIMANVTPRIKQMSLDIKNHVHDGRRGEIVRKGVRMALVGAPNSGKSTLYNMFAKREAAIVTKIPGTTRDVLELHINIGGYPVVIADTAGLRNSCDEIEKEGIKRGKKWAITADILLTLIDSKDFLKELCKPHANINKSIFFDDFSQTSPKKVTIIVLTKYDLVSDKIAQGLTCPSSSILHQLKSKSKKISRDNLLASAAKEYFATLNPQCSFSSSICVVSVHSKFGISSLWNNLEEHINTLFPTLNTNSVLLTRDRHRQHLYECLDFLSHFTKKHRKGDLVLATEHLRLAGRALGKIVGVVDVEELLDVIFNDFCIGK